MRPPTRSMLANDKDIGTLPWEETLAEADRLEHHDADPKRPYEFMYKARDVLRLLRDSPQLTRQKMAVLATINWPPHASQEAGGLIPQRPPSKSSISIRASSGHSLSLFWSS